VESCKGQSNATRLREKYTSLYGNTIIIEYTKNESYWADGGAGSGKNMPGKILMKVRAELTKNGLMMNNELKQILLPPWLKYPQIQRYSIGWRMGYGESYFMEWGSWYDSLSDKGKELYQQQYPAQGEWEGYYQEEME
jgi:hypothetical protein